MITHCEYGHDRSEVGEKVIRDGRRFCAACYAERGRTKLTQHERNKRARDRGRARKLRLLAMFGGCCVDCGFSGHPTALDFDHVDPRTKEFQLSRAMQREPWLRLVEEASKCVIRCANCHRIKTHFADEYGRGPRG